MTATMPWFRVYSEILDDRKIKRICARTGYNKSMVIGAWVCLLAMASSSPQRGELILAEGLPYTIEEIADDLGLSTTETTTLLDEFTALNMIVSGETVVISHWDNRQFQSDNVTARTRKFRERKESKEQQEEEDGNVSGTFDRTLLSVSASASESINLINKNSENLKNKTSIPGILMRAANLSAIPPGEMARVEQIHCLIETYGADRVETALKDAAQRWVGKKNKNGRTYPVTNMAWVDWGQEILDGQPTSINVTREVWDAWSDKQKQEYIDAGGDIPYG